MFTAALCVITKNWKKPKCPRKGKGSQSAVHPHNGILLSNKKVTITGICNNRDGTQYNYTVKDTT